MAKAYGEQRLEAACKRALKSSSFTYRIISNILTKNLDTLESVEQSSLFSMPIHDNLRGAEVFH